MKKLLKSEICGFVNSVRVHCSPWKSQQIRAKKKKKRENTEEAKRGRDKLDPNRHLVSV